jgi:8-oxo-dGTP pyrophosphatase MutT (NUDIX family)
MSSQDFLPDSPLNNVCQGDAEAQRVQVKLDWGLASFISVFDPSLERVLLVQLGDYARKWYSGNPWTLPGGGVEPGEAPSQGILRELKEETGLSLSGTGLRLAAWLPRPYFTPRNRARPGELLLLFAAILDPADCAPRPNPPEIKAVGFQLFSLQRMLSIPAQGEGEHELQPLPRHWVYWASLGKACLGAPERPASTHVYSNSQDMRLPPWPQENPP